MVEKAEHGTLTDVCYREDVAEVDLVSLIEEQIPRYVLRADTLTDFAGYDNQDWIQTPCLPPDTNLDLSPIVIEETLKYFVLCADRVGQMTKTYNDIEAVTRLLEEKERDLELAARIGQTLLEKNKELASINENLDEQLTEATEQVSQLRHEVSMKDALLQVYVNDDDPDTPTPTRDKLAFGLSALDGLQKKVKVLEDENNQLRIETNHLKSETSDLEEKEASIVKDAIKHIDEVNNQITALHDEIGNKAEVNLRQQEDITALMTKCINLESKIKKMTVENAELSGHLGAAQEAQRQLTQELSELTDRYYECLALLHDAQEEVKVLRHKKNPGVMRTHLGGCYNPLMPPEGSLASELEDSLRKEMPYPEGYSPAERKAHNSKVMETVKSVRRSRRRGSGSLHSVPGSSNTSGNESCESIAGSSNRSSLYLSDENMMNESVEADSMYGSVSSNLGKPGLPGSNDLETALKRLSMRKANEINEKILREEDDKKLSEEVDKKIRGGSDSGQTGTETPDSVMSTNSGSNMSDLSRLSGLSFPFRLPEKLQIVKPMEGSLTLHQWQRLATPHLGGFLDPRPGVQIKGENPIELDEPVFNLDDLEEDSAGMSHDVSHDQWRSHDTSASNIPMHAFSNPNVVDRSSLVGAVGGDDASGFGQMAGLNQILGLGAPTTEPSGPQKSTEANISEVSELADAGLGQMSGLNQILGLGGQTIGASMSGMTESGEAGARRRYRTPSSSDSDEAVAMTTRPATRGRRSQSRSLLSVIPNSATEASGCVIS